MYTFCCILQNVSVLCYSFVLFDDQLRLFLLIYLQKSWSDEIRSVHRSSNSSANVVTAFRNTWLVSILGQGRYSQQPIRYVIDTDLADTIRIQYDTHVHDLRFQTIWILDFNNKVNVLGWSIQWIQQILMLKRNDHLCSTYHSFIYKVLVQHN